MKYCLSQGYVCIINGSFRYNLFVASTAIMVSSVPSTTLFISLVSKAKLFIVSTDPLVHAPSLLIPQNTDSSLLCFATIMKKCCTLSGHQHFLGKVSLLTCNRRASPRCASCFKPYRSAQINPPFRSHCTLFKIPTHASSLQLNVEILMLQWRQLSQSIGLSVGRG